MTEMDISERAQVGSIGVYLKKNLISRAIKEKEEYRGEAVEEEELGQLPTDISDNF